MTTININEAKNGIEIKFDCKPSTEILSSLKDHGFRWSSRNSLWWAKLTEERMAFAKTIDTSAVMGKCRNEAEKPYNLFEMTRTDKIGNNWVKYHITDCKEIAAIIRKHIRERFKMCKWSVRMEHHDYISISLLSSPWDIESAEVNAILDYVYAFAESYNYDNSDSMTDYFDVNFYGVYRSSLVSKYDYTQREETVAEHNISEQFKIDLAAFEKAEEERKQREHEEAMKQMEIDRQRAAEIEKRREAETAEIEANHTVEDCDMWCLNVRLGANKVSNLDYVDDDYYVNHGRENCRATRKVTFSERVYNLFIQYLLTDFSFLTQMGGTSTDDYRINNEEDYYRMSKEERETVEFYNNYCVVIYCENEPKLVIDPQGSNYARYAYIIDSEATMTEEYHPSTGNITKEEMNAAAEIAAKLEEHKNEICDNTPIDENDPYTLTEKNYDGDCFELFKSLMTEYIIYSGIKFNVDVVRAIKDFRFKGVMYKVLNEPDDIRSQFMDANMQTGEKYTVIQIDGMMGMLTKKHIIFDSYTEGKYAQYDNAVKMIYTLPRKRNKFYRWLYKEVLIYHGWVDIPDDVLYETVKSTPGVTCKQSKFGSCDHRQYAAIIEYFKSKGVKPIINTYKPIFG